MNQKSTHPENSITFTLFADLHYKEGMYIAGVQDMQQIVNRAGESHSDLILHCGDLCNDYKGSPELTNVYLHNSLNLPVFGVYGNHELETTGNTMQLVTPQLTNQPNNVVWGTESGKIEDGTRAYYYFDRNGFRFVCTDTNYSYNPSARLWEHNPSPSYGPPQGNHPVNCLGENQFIWLEKVLNNAAQQHLCCIVVSHDSFSGIWGSSPDGEKVRSLFRAANARAKHTVVMALNGHYHQTHTAVKDDVFYFDIPAALNGVWRLNRDHHYQNGQTFSFTAYNEAGVQTQSFTRNITELSMAKHTYFFQDPLSAVVTVSKAGHIQIEGTKTAYRYSIVPEEARQDAAYAPQISNLEIQL